MATNISGTNLAAPIAPFTTDDKYATHFSEYGKGGWHEVATKANLANIPTQRLSEGMAARVISENKTYIYTKQSDDKYEWLQDTIDIDEELSSTSTNPVQNKAVQAALAAQQTSIDNLLPLIYAGL